MLASVWTTEEHLLTGGVRSSGSRAVRRWGAPYNSPRRNCASVLPLGPPIAAASSHHFSASARSMATPLPEPVSCARGSIPSAYAFPMLNCALVTSSAAGETPSGTAAGMVVGSVAATSFMCSIPLSCPWSHTRTLTYTARFLCSCKDACRYKLGVCLNINTCIPCSSRTRGLRTRSHQA